MKRSKNNRRRDFPEQSGTTIFGVNGALTGARRRSPGHTISGEVVLSCGHPWSRKIPHFSIEEYSYVAKRNALNLPAGTVFPSSAYIRSNKESEVRPDTSLPVSRKKVTHVCFNRFVLIVLPALETKNTCFAVTDRVSFVAGLLLVRDQNN